MNTVPCAVSNMRPWLYFAVCLLGLIYFANSATIRLQDFNVNAQQTDPNVAYQGNIIKVGCAMGYVRMRGRCRKIW